MSRLHPSAAFNLSLSLLLLSCVQSRRDRFSHPSRPLCLALCVWLENAVVTDSDHKNKSPCHLRRSSCRHTVPSPPLHAANFRARVRPRPRFGPPSRFLVLRVCDVDRAFSRLLSSSCPDIPPSAGCYPFRRSLRLHPPGHGPPLPSTIIIIISTISSTLLCSRYTKSTKRYQHNNIARHLPSQLYTHHIHLLRRRQHHQHVDLDFNHQSVFYSAISYAPVDDDILPPHHSRSLPSRRSLLTQPYRQPRHLRLCCQVRFANRLNLLPQSSDSCPIHDLSIAC